MLCADIIKLRVNYAVADPFPHAVIDNFLEASIIGDVVEELRRTKVTSVWSSKKRSTGVKQGLSNLDFMGQHTRSAVTYLNSKEFITKLQVLTGIHGLIPDLALTGSGIHRIERGGFLNVHADHNFLGELHRRVNVLLYLNEDWKEKYGGHLELWGLKQCKSRILPICNRAVIFNTTDTSYHGHPEPLTCPTNRTRDSIALYYYTKNRPDKEKSKSHSTLYKKERLA